MLLALPSEDGGPARGGITQLDGASGRAALAALAGAGTGAQAALGCAEAGLGAPLFPGPGVHAEATHAETPRVARKRAGRVKGFTMVTA